jgi:hypothetical protein
MGRRSLRETLGRELGYVICIHKALLQAMPMTQPSLIQPFGTYPKAQTLWFDVALSALAEQVPSFQAIRTTAGRAFFNPPADNASVDDAA